LANGADVTPRRILLNIHLYLGLTAGAVLIVLGLTGAIIAFEADIPHWLHPGLFYVHPGAAPLSEQELVRNVERRFAPARVGAVQILRATNLAHVFLLPDRVWVFGDPYTGAILGSVQGGFRSDRIVGYIHQIHLRLVPIPAAVPRLAAAGKVLVSWAGLLLCLLVPTGLILFWRTRRSSVKWSATLFRICFDLHHVVGAYASLFLMVAALTGVLIGFESGEQIIFALSGSGQPSPVQAPQSAPVEGVVPLTLDRAIEIARARMPDAVVAGYSVPRKPVDAITVSLRVPEETSEAVRSSVTIDQYSGAVLQVRDFRTDSAGVYWVRFNRSLHTGDVLGTPTRIVAALSSLLLVVMVLTGLVIWWRKLAV
jgi:uncharacterized iron-regulated membrane protein